MRVFALIVVVLGVWTTVAVRAEEPAPELTPEVEARAVKPLPAPSDAKINSVVTNKPKPGAVATAGQALIADGLAKTVWANVKGTAIDSSPASAGTVLTADGSGGAAWAVNIGPTITANLVGNVTGNVTGNVSGSSAIFTGTLAGDVTGPQSATVVSTVGGVTAANVASGANLANAATNAATPNTIVKRDANGNFTATELNFTGPLAGDVTGTQSATAVQTVGGVTAANVAAGANLANAATTAATPNTLVKRDGTGNFAAVTITGNLTGNVTGNVTGNASGTAANVTGVVAIANGGTGSNTQNFVDLSSNQSPIAGNKSFTGTLAVSTAFSVEPRPNNTGASNLFAGTGAGAASTTGFSNIFVGVNAGLSNTAGNGNAFFGPNAGKNNVGGGNNAFLGNGAGFFNANGSYNTLVGSAAGQSITASDNTFIGALAGVNATSGAMNTFVGSNAGAGSGSNSGSNNTFVGWYSGNNTTTGSSNSYFGLAAGQLNTTGMNNTFIGQNAGQANTTGQNNIALGSTAGNQITTTSNNIDIGNSGVSGDAGAIKIGTSGTHSTAFIQGVFGVTVTGGSAVSILSNGQLGTVTSSRRFKDNIQPMGASSDALLQLNPVTFTYKKALDPKSIPQWGLIAEEVAAINPEWVVRDEKGEINTVRYEQINAMQLNEFLKEHKKVEALEARDKARENRLAGLEAKDKARDARLARIEKILDEEQSRAVRAFADKE